MATLYWLNILDLSGDILAQLNDDDAGSGFQYLVATQKRNDVGILRSIISQEIPQAAIWDELEAGEMYMAELYRSDIPAGIATYREWGGFVRPGRRRAEGKRLLIEITGVHENALLEWRRVLWPADTANRSTFATVEAETVAKTLVQYNATTSATTGAGRATSGAYTAFPITIEADEGRGNEISVSFAWLNLLPALQRVSTLGGGDFRLVKDSESVSWEFQWRQPYLGTDRSDDVVFSLDRDNMENPVLTLTNPWEPTVAVVAGQGQGDQRTLVVRTGPNYVSDFHREVFVDARDLSTIDALQDRGDERLDELKSRDTLDFVPLQTDALRYGRDYFLGDLVTGRFSGIEITPQIDSVEIELPERGFENIKIGLRSV